MQVRPELDRLSCHRFVVNQVRLHLFIPADNLRNSLRRVAVPEAVKDWSLRSVQVKLFMIRGEASSSTRGGLVFQLAVVAMPRELVPTNVERINELRPLPG